MLLKSTRIFFVERNTSTATKISLLRKFFKAYGADEEALIFILKDSTTDKSAEEAGTRAELRRKYWAFALPYIQKANDDGTGHGCFSGCTTSKENWINGFLWNWRILVCLRGKLQDGEDRAVFGTLQKRKEQNNLLISCFSIKRRLKRGLEHRCLGSEWMIKRVPILSSRSTE